jgi:hypothetical protein
MTQLQQIREGTFPRFAPIIGIANVDTPDEAEPTETRLPGARTIMTFEDEKTTLGDLLLCARTLEAAGHRVVLRFTRLGDEPTNPVWGISVAVTT